MRFVFVSEGQLTKGQTYESRLREVVEEAVLAERMGFHAVGTSEQHFVRSMWTISAPEVLFGAIAQATHTVKIRHMSIVALKFNHGLRIAERLATLDALSRGRVEFGTARSNNINYMKTLGVNPATTREEWRETLEVTVRALMQRPVEFHGKYYDFGPLEDVTPRLYQSSCPPMYLSASSLETHRTAGELGLGVMHFDNWFGWEYAEKALAEYDQGAKNVAPIGGLYEPTRSKSMLTFLINCAETKERAMRELRHSGEAILLEVVHMYKSLYESGGKEFAYLKEMGETLGKHITDLDYVQQMSPCNMIGDPDFFIERIKKYEKMGCNEIIMRIDGMGHQANKHCIEMIGKYVIPEFRNPNSLPQSDQPEDLGVKNVPKFLL